MWFPRCAECVRVLLGLPRCFECVRVLLLGCQGVLSVLECCYGVGVAKVFFLSVLECCYGVAKVF